MTCKCANKYTVQTVNEQVEVNADDVRVPPERYSTLIFYRGGEQVASFANWEWFKQED